MRIAAVVLFCSIREVIDCDVHQTLKSFDDLKPYLPRVWWERLSAPEATLPISIWKPIPLSRRDASPGNGLPPGSDPEYAKVDLLDRYNIDKAILTGSLLTVSAHNNPDYAAAVASAFNDYTLDTWIPTDDRWLASFTVVAKGTVSIPQFRQSVIQRQILNVTISWRSIKCHI